MTIAGAMAPEVEYLEKAFVLKLPDDSHGRAVFYMDRIRTTKEVAPRDSVVRCMWYVAQTMVEEVRYQKRGMVGISNYRGFDLYKHFDRIMTKKLLWCVKSIPVPLMATHCCTGSGASVAGDLVLPVVK